jgi:hypothetical protein
MSIRLVATRFTFMAMMVGLVACAGPEAKESQSQEAQSKEVTYYPSGFDPAKDPYWEDPRWDKTLLDTLQQAVHDPVDTNPISTPGLHATVKFTLENRIVEYPEITSSTGNPNLDVLMLHQVASVRVPLPTTGLQIDQPHEFELDLDMPTPLETFESTIYGAIEYWKVYPKNPILEGLVGDTTVAFDFKDGKASDIVMATSSKNKELDRSSIAAVTKATMPAAPAAYAGKSLHMEVLFCYTLIMSDYGTAPVVKNQCPVARNVIRIEGTRVKRVDTYQYP